MPVIEMYVTEGALDEGAKRGLHERVSRAVLEAEGASYESELARAITWVLIHEMPEGTFSVGSEVRSASDEPRILTRVTVPHGAGTEKQTAAIAAAVNQEVVATLGETFAEPTKALFILEEHTFAGAATVVDYEALVELLAGSTAASSNGASESEPAAVAAS